MSVAAAVIDTAAEVAPSGSSASAADALAFSRAASLRFKGVMERIAVFQAGSEGIFLEIGRRLQAMEERCRALASQSDSSTGMMAAAQGARPSEILGQSLDVLERHLRESRGVAAAGVEGLSHVLVRIDSLTSAGDEFQQIASTLRALATSLRVEDGRKAGGSGFDSVSSDVSRLGGMIQVKFGAILGKANELHVTAERARTQEREFLDRHGKQSMALLADARNGLAGLRAMDAVAEGVRSDAAAAVSESARLASNILVSLQVHDITRQMLEHVVEALQGFSADLSGKDSEGKSPEQMLAVLASLARVQSLQVRKARTDLIAAQRSIAQSLRTMASSIARIANERRRLVGDRQGGALLEKVESTVARAAKTLHEHLSYEKQTVAAADSVARVAGSMEEFLVEISAMANDVKVVALNALVKAVKTGSSGAAFAVLAQAIKNLSLDVANHTEIVAKALRDMAGQARIFAQQTAVGDATEQAEAEGTEQRLASLVQDLREYHRALSASVEEYRAGAAQVSTEIEEIVSRLDRQAKAARELEQVERDLARLSDEAAAAAGPAAAVSSEHLEAAMGRYTMESERSIHRQTLHEATALPQPSASAAGTGGLGDNVELF